MHGIDSSKYVVLDVETNGLSSLRDDLLSLSIYKPDSHKCYSRYFPLEMQSSLRREEINGITHEMIKGKKPLTQEEFDQIVKDFDLHDRIILTYGGIDEKFVRNYLKRKRIKGFEDLTFHNIKHDIISSKFSDGSVTKDNLCILFNIQGVSTVHSGLNDCILEWKLFEKMGGRKMIVINYDAYFLNNEYIVPVSYLQNYPNLKYCVKTPQLNEYGLKLKIVFSINNRSIKKLEKELGPKNSGVIIEEQINTMLDVNRESDEDFIFQIENKGKLERIGTLGASRVENLSLDEDGKIISNGNRKIKDLNKAISELQNNLAPLVAYIKSSVFNGEPINSQEVVVSKEDNVYAKCDLSSKSTIMEIKSYNVNVNDVKYQLHYESKGRQIYLLKMLDCSRAKKVYFAIYEVGRASVEFSDDESAIVKAIQKDMASSYSANKSMLEKKIKKLVKDNKVRVAGYNDKKAKVSVECLKCGAKYKFNKRRLLALTMCPSCGVGWELSLNRVSRIKNNCPMTKVSGSESNGDIISVL